MIGPLALALAVAHGVVADPVAIGSKQFTESVILGEVVRLAGALAGLTAEHRRELGGTRILWEALLRGDIDVYPEYTGTIASEILAGELGAAGLEPFDRARADQALARHGVRIVAALGFEDSYALGMTRARATALGIRSISDLVAHPELRLRFSAEFLERQDGWASLAKAYALPQRDVRGLDHDLAYRGLAAGDVDVLDLYSTDAEIRYYDLVVLSDDRAHFPRYDAVLLARADLDPAWSAVLVGLAGRIDAAHMIAMNARAKLDRVAETQVAADFLAGDRGHAVTADVEGAAARILRHTGEHLLLVGVALALSLACGVPLGILAARRRRLGQLLLGAVGVVQTIPSLALLVLFIPLLGIGTAPAIVALSLYGLLPIVRNTHQGLTQIPTPLLESAAALGLPARAVLARIELPLASPAILAGIKTSAVIAVGTATLGAVIGAGGYGEPILTGIRLDDTGLILEGAIPAALLAVLVQLAFEQLERRVVPRGLGRL